jgi:hypothetical protein
MGEEAPEARIELAQKKAPGEAGAVSTRVMKTGANDGSPVRTCNSVRRRRFRGGRGISATQLTLLLWITATSIDSRKAVRLKYRRSEWSACI